MLQAELPCCWSCSWEGVREEEFQKANSPAEQSHDLHLRSARCKLIAIDFLVCVRLCYKSGNIFSLGRDLTGKSSQPREPFLLFYFYFYQCFFPSPRTELCRTLALTTDLVMLLFCLGCSTASFYGSKHNQMWGHILSSPPPFCSHPVPTTPHHASPPWSLFP